ncbi:hypothetical protein B0I35DRAFT_36134 [Stachybotrys elegans]|uniref:Uncharacterized protein n=1 Tax=Stachybotrys elegans TaxID=80388 RepID=A0A8K0T5B1_9HYPO|nr:hypothetical protein B0I35DRAFT_36134 [Stachybotrys elegans]
MSSRAWMPTMVLDDESVHGKWTPVDAGSLAPTFDSEDGNGELRTFLDSASTTTRSNSVTSSLPSAFLISSSTSADTMQMGRRPNRNKHPKLTLKAQAQARASDARAAARVDQDDGTIRPDSNDERTSTRDLSRMGGTGRGRRRRIPPVLLLSPSVSSLGSFDYSEYRQYQRWELEIERQQVQNPTSQADPGEQEDPWFSNPQLRRFDQHLLPEQRPFAPRSPASAEPLTSASVGLSTSIHDTGFAQQEGDETSAAYHTVPSAMMMTREEFEALPPTIQRKVRAFSLVLLLF